MDNDRYDDVTTRIGKRTDEQNNNENKLSSKECETVNILIINLCTRVKGGHFEQLL